MKDKKGLIRKEYISIRNTIPKQRKIQASNIILDKIVNLPQIIKSKCILAYLSLPQEVQTRQLINNLIKMDKKVAIPKTNQPKRTMNCHYITDINKDTSLGAYNIFEPKESLKMAKSGEIEIVIVPGIAFDRNGGRLGFGAGYYDRFLNQEKQLIKIGICFSEQVTSENIPQEKTDVKMDLIVTDKEIIII